MAFDLVVRNGVVIDGTGALSPGPTTPLEVPLHRRTPVVRALAPAENDHPFNFLTPSVPALTAFSRAVAAAHGGETVPAAAPLGRIQPVPLALTCVVFPVGPLREGPGGWICA